MKVLILAGGRGKRLSPLTSIIPKPMSPVLRKPILYYLIINLKKAGLKDYIILTGYKGRVIRKYFGDGKKFGINIEYVNQEKRLGMGHAVLICEEIVSDNFLVVAGDNIFQTRDIQELIIAHNTGRTASVISLDKLPLEALGHSSSVLLDGSVVKKIVEKPCPEEVLSNVCSCPLYVFNRKIFDYLKKIKISKRGEYELQNALQLMIDDGNVVEGKFITHRYHLTSLKDLFKLNLIFLKKSILSKS